MIVVYIIGVLAIVGWFASLFAKIKSDREELLKLKAKDVTDEAKKIVGAKDPNELLDDFNKRYSGDGTK